MAQSKRRASTEHRAEQAADTQQSIEPSMAQSKRRASTEHRAKQAADTAAEHPHILPQLRGLAVPIASLTPDPANARTHDEDNLAAIMVSLERFGQRKPVVVQRDGMVVRAGNGTVEAARRLGWTHIAALVVDEDRDMATAFAIADNRTGDLAGWNNQALADLLKSLPDGIRDATGYDGTDLDGLLAGLATAPAEDDVPEPLPAVVTRWKDVWTLGEHRLMCGDSTQAECVDTLMAGAKADLCFTSPPYGNQRQYTEASREHLSDWDALMRGVFANLPMSDAGQVLVNLGLVHRDGEWLPYWDGWIAWMRKHGWRRFGWYVWDQGSGFPGTFGGRCAPSHEFVFHFNRASTVARKHVRTKCEGKRHAGGQMGPSGWVDDSARRSVTGAFKIPDSVWRINRKTEDNGHSAIFPVALPAFAIATWNPATVFEPLSGSGTTIVACEQAGRRCYAMEIEPRYVDIAIRRWQNLTGKSATLGGRAWTDIAAERA